MDTRNTNILTFPRCLLQTTLSVLEDTIHKVLKHKNVAFKFVFHWSKDCFFCGPRIHAFSMPMQTSSDRLFKFASGSSCIYSLEKIRYEFICTRTHALWVKLDSARVKLKKLITYGSVYYSSLQHFPLVFRYIVVC